MKKLLKIEWMKLKHSNTTKSILAIYAVVVPTMYLLLSYLQLGPLSIPEQAYQFPDAYNMVAWTASWFNLMVGVIVIVFTTNEIKYRTQRQNVIDGLSKRDVIISKFLVVIGLSAVVSIYTLLVGLVVGLINGVGNMFDGMEFIGVYFISTLGYFSFAFLFASLVRLPALAIIIYIFSTLIEEIVGFIAVQKYAQFFPLSTFSDLVPFPLNYFSEPIPDPYIMDTGMRTVLASAYIMVFIMISYWVLRKRDL